MCCRPPGSARDEAAAYEPSIGPGRGRTHRACSVRPSPTGEGLVGCLAGSVHITCSGSCAFQVGLPSAGVNGWQGLALLGVMELVVDEDLRAEEQAQASSWLEAVVWPPTMQACLQQPGAACTCMQHGTDGQWNVCVGFSVGMMAHPAGAAPRNQHNLPSGGACRPGAWHLPLRCLSLQAQNCNIGAPDISRNGTASCMHSCLPWVCTMLMCAGRYGWGLCCLLNGWPVD